jgi:hypothetical protein
MEGKSRSYSNVFDGVQLIYILITLGFFSKSDLCKYLYDVTRAVYGFLQLQFWKIFYHVGSSRHVSKKESKESETNEVRAYKRDQVGSKLTT